MRQLTYSEYKGANKLLFFELNREVQIDVVRNVITQVDPDARVEFLGYAEELDRYVYVIIIKDEESTICEDRVVAYELVIQD